MGTPPRSLRSSERVDPEEFSRRVAGKLGDAADSVDVRNGTIHVSVPARAVVGAARTLKDDPELDCAYFTFLSAIDWEADGFEVLVALSTLTYGNTVILEHGGGDYSVYGSLDRIDVRRGSRVIKGQAIGTVGVSDPALGPHLHFEIRRGGPAVDPAEWLRAVR